MGILPFRAKGDALLQARSICPKLVGTVVARIGFQVCDCSSQIFDCSLNVTPTCSLTTRLKYCAVSTWVSAMISLALLSRSLRFRNRDQRWGRCAHVRALVSPDLLCLSRIARRTTFPMLQCDRSDQFCVTRLCLVSALLASLSRLYQRRCLAASGYSTAFQMLGDLRIGSSSSCLG